MTQKKFLQIAAIAVGFVWVFCATFAIAITVQRKSEKEIPVTNPLATTTTMPTTNPMDIFGTSPNTPVYNTTSPLNSTSPAPVTPTTQAPTQAATQPSTQAQPSAVPQGKDAIVAAYVNGVNQLKNTPNFLLNKNDKLDIEIDEITGGSAIESVAKTLIPKPEPESYTFLGGVDAATGKTPNQAIAPLNVAAKVDINAVTNAAAQQNADGGYTVQLTIKEEQQTLTAAAPNLSTMVEVIDIQSLIPDGFTLEAVNINYSPSTITAVFDSQGRIVSMQHVLVSQGGGSGTAKVLVANIPASMTMHGTFTSDYTIIYN